MQTNQDTIIHLTLFLKRDKFAPIVWRVRGITPSNQMVAPLLTSLFNNCAQSLLIGVEKNYHPRQLKSMLRFSLASINRGDFDFAERTFIADLYSELSEIVKINFRHTLHIFRHGPFLGTLMYIKPMLRPTRIILQYCDDCKSKLETLVLREDKKEPDYGWNVIQCSHCGEFNLLHLGSGVKAVRFGRYKSIEHLNKQDYTAQEAEHRLEQIRYYRRR